MFSSPISRRRSIASSRRSSYVSSSSSSLSLDSDPCVMSYKKLYGYLNEKNLKLYKLLTKSHKMSSSKMSFHSIFEKKKPFTIIKQTENMVVFVYKNSVLKLKNANYEQYHQELFFTNAFFEEEIRTLISENGYLMILPKYQRSLSHYQYFSSDHFSNLKEDIVKQLFNFHRNHCIHNDINENNIVKIKNDDGNHHWKVIDFSKMILMSHSEDEEVIIQTESGETKLVPNYIKIKETTSDKDIFWTFMNDWKAFVYLLSNFLEETNDDIMEIKESYKNKDKIKMIKMMEKIGSQYSLRIPEIYYR